MDLMGMLQKKRNELGVDAVAAALGITRGMIFKYLCADPEASRPGGRICQKIIDLWGDEMIADYLTGKGKADEDIIEEVRKVSSEEKKEIAERNIPLWEGRDVCLCLPQYNRPHPSYMFSIMAMWDRTKMRLEHRANDSMIARSRNHIAKRFVESGCEWSIWFDDDMIFPFGNAGIYYTMLGGPRHIPSEFLGVHTINRLTSWKKTVVGGMYWDRRGSGRLIAGGSTPILSPIPSNTLAAVKFVGTGCLAVHRQVYLDIEKKFPDVINKNAPGNESGYFAPILDQSGRMMGEDESFAWRATEAGHPSHLDLGLICGHVGDAIRTLPEKGSKM